MCKTNKQTNINVIARHKFANIFSIEGTKQSFPSTTFERSRDKHEKTWRKRFAYTLAEILIVLGIIGVVSAMTIPTMINDFQDQQYKTAYKKAYSAISQAFLNASREGDIGSLTGTYGSDGSEANFEAIKNQFVVIKECDDSNIDECWDKSGEHWRSDHYDVPSFVDKSGFAWKLRNLDAVNGAPAILVDTNGLKGPNKYGQDRFPFTYRGSPGTTWSNINETPTKIMPFAQDITADDISDSNKVTSCHSLETHPCYYTKWLYD